MSGDLYSKSRVSLSLGSDSSTLLPAAITMHRGSGVAQGQLGKTVCAVNCQLPHYLGY